MKNLKRFTTPLYLEEFLKGHSSEYVVGWEELKGITKEFLSNTGWHPTYIEQVAGAIRYSKYNFFKKYILRNIAQKNNAQTDTSEDYEYTDWTQVQRILAKVEKAVEEIHKPEKVSS